MSLSYAVWRIMQDGLEVRVSQTDYTNPALAVRKASAEARKWWRVLNAPTKPRKPDQIPMCVAVRVEGGSYPNLYHLIEVRQS